MFPSLVLSDDTTVSSFFQEKQQEVAGLLKSACSDSTPQPRPHKQPLPDQSPTAENQKTGAGNRNESHISQGHYGDEDDEDDEDERRLSASSLIPVVATDPSQ